MGVLQQTAPKFDQDECIIWNKNTIQPHQTIKVYQDLNAWTRTVEISVCINNWSLQICSQREAEIEQKSSRLLENFGTS